MSLPIILPSGTVLVYGLGISSYNSVQAADPRVVFGSIYQVWAGGDPFYSANDYIMFDARLATVVIYGNYPYTQVDARLATKMSPPL